MWFRVFATDEEAPQPSDLLAQVQADGLAIRGDFVGEGRGWVRVDFSFDEHPAPVRVDRYLAGEEDVRENLNAWAAWLETVDGNLYVNRLMQHMIGTQQVFALEVPRDDAEGVVGRFAMELCQYLARATHGVFQVDSRGFFAPDGKLLVPE
jgi:hypothetical protein